MYIPNSKWTWIFLAIALVQACVVLAFESYVFAKFRLDSEKFNNGEDNKIQRAVTTFLSLYIFGFIYDIVLVYDALRMRNTIQVIGLVLMNVGLLIYGAIQLDTISDAVIDLSNQGLIDNDLWPMLKPYMIAIPCILAVTTIFMGFVAWKLYHEFAWTIYKHISADLRMRKRYLNYQIFIALLKFDFFFFLGFTIQFVVIVRGRSETEFRLTIAAIPVTIIILFLAALFTRREILSGMIAVLLLFLAGLGYFIFKLNRMYQNGFELPYIPARKEMTAFAVLTILAIIITIVYAVICCTGFGKGLKPFVSGQRASTDEEKPSTLGSPSHYSDGGYNYSQNVEMTDPYKANTTAHPARMQLID